MEKEEDLLEYWHESDTKALESEYVPQTPLAKKLWEIRQRAIASGMQLLNEEEIEQELVERRG